MPEAESSERVAKLVATASRLALDAATADVLRAFERVGARALLLKGASIARWLYAEGEPRTYVDCDVLVAPADVAAAEEVLATPPTTGASSTTARCRRGGASMPPRGSATATD